MKTEELLSQLTQDLRPTRRRSTLLVVSVGVASLALYVIALQFTAFPPRADLAGIFWLRFWGLALLPLILGGLALIFAAFQLRDRPYSLLPTLALFLALLGYGGYCLWYSAGTAAANFFAWNGIDLKCAALILASSLPVWALGIIATHYVLPLSRQYERFVAFLAIATGAFLINLHCPFDGQGHHFLGHALIPAVLAALAYLPLAYGSRRLRAKIAGRRSSSVLKLG